MAKTKLSSRGQIVIPKEIREKLGLSPGQKLEVYEEDDKIVLIAIPEDPVDSLNGMFQTERSGRRVTGNGQGRGRTPGSYI